MAYSAKTFSPKIFVDTYVNREFNIWDCGCPHCSADRSNGRNSITQSISEILRFRPDYSYIKGDFGSNQGGWESTSPTDVTDAIDVAAQLNSNAGLPPERQEKLLGNHDGSEDPGTYTLFRTYVDPMGENTATSGVNPALFPYPRTGDWRRGTTLIGNLLCIRIGDANGDGCPPAGFPAGPLGGYPSGSWLLSDEQWFESVVLANQDKNIFVFAHHLLKDTTVATGDNEGVLGGFHGSTGQPIGSGRLHNIIIDSTTYEDDQTRIQTFLNANPGCIQAWFGAHTHYNVGETYAGRTWYYVDANGVYHVNNGGLTRYHVLKQPQSGLIKLTEGSSIAKNYKMHHGGYYKYAGLDSNYVLNIPLRYAFEYPA